MEVQFVNAVFAILAPIAATLPLLIHLLSLRRRRYVTFTMLRLLERAALQAQGARRLREWLIVIVRSLAVLFLFIALSRPLVRGVHLSALGGASICILVDDSMSMAFLDGAESRFKVALECAKKLIHDLPNARFCILSLSHPDKVVCHWTSDANEALKRLMWMRVGVTQSSTGQALLNALRGLKLADGANSHLFIFTDGQVVPALCKNAQMVDRGKIDVTVIDVRRSPDEDVNVAAVDWDVNVAPLSSPHAAMLKLLLRNFGRKGWNGTVSVIVDGNLAAELKEANIAARGELSAAIPIKLGSSGWHKGLVLWRDALPLDNRLHFAFYNPLPMRVLCIGSWKHDGDGTFYIIRALESIRDSVGANSIVIGKSASLPQSLDELKRWHAIIWCHPRGAARSSEAALRAWLSLGGTIISFVDRHATDLPDWLSPKRTHYKRGGEKPFRITISDASHPVTQRISNELLKDVLVFEHSIADGASAGRIVLRFDNGHPALTEKDFGVGRAITFWMGANMTESTLPISVAFVPLLCELLQYAVMQSHIVLKVVGDGGVKIEHGKVALLSSRAIVSNVELSDSDTRIPSYEDLRKLVTAVGWRYLTLSEWHSGLRINVPVDATMFFVVLCAMMLLAETLLEVRWIRRKHR
ncbi:MAG: VWA domain-containing protein [Armatimonadota bacterium]|nr:VWA domain-containing protein [Armatimonadota bacterium]MCX7776730.1 VWA domain-containing protein [Armatimonadota bacterium]MDW8025799.1 VWA domain-containing protein [Armatimonadota bacterium]